MNKNKFDRPLTIEEEVIVALSCKESIEKIANNFSENDCVIDSFNTEWHKGYCTDDGSQCLDCWKSKILEIKEEIK